MSQQKESSSTQAPGANESKNWSKNWSWLKSISRELCALNSSPLLGYVPDFPFEKLGSLIAQSFGLQEVKIEKELPVFRDTAHLLENIEAPYIGTQLTASGINGKISFVLPQTHIHELMTSVLGLTPGDAALIDRSFFEAFERFVELEVLSHINAIGFQKKTSFSLSSSREIPQEPALCQDIWITLHDKRFLSRLIIPAKFKAAWRQFSFQAFSQKPDNSVLEHLPVTLHVEAARTTVFLNDLLKAKVGDFLLIDHPFFENEDLTSQCLLSVNQKPLFLASLEKNAIKILEIPSPHEVLETMVEQQHTNEHDENQNPHDENHEVELSSEDDAEETHEEENEEENEELEEEENIFGDEEEDGEDEDEEDEFELYEEVDQTDEKHLAVDNNKEPHKESSSENSLENLPPHKQSDKGASTTPATDNILQTVAAPELKAGELSISDIPVTISLELAQIQTNMQKLLELSPGNMLDLHIHTDHPLLLVVNGKIVGKGEILKIGDTLGVRILEIGSPK